MLVSLIAGVPSIIRVALSRLTTAFIMLYLALYFDAEELAKASVIVLLFNFVELVLEGGYYEYLVRKYSLSVRLGYFSISRYLILMSLFCVVLASVVYEFYWLLLLGVSVFPLFLNQYIVSILKYRGRFLLITKIYSKVSLLVLMSFFVFLFWFDSYGVVAAVLLVQQIALMCLLRSYRYFGLLFSYKGGGVRDYFSGVLVSFLFKLSAFFSSRFVEVVLISLYGKVLLSNFVAGGRIYNVVCLFIFAFVNEVVLRRFGRLELSERWKEERVIKLLALVLFVLSPFFVLLNINSTEIISFIFGDKYPLAGGVFYFFNLLGVVQVGYIVVYQLSLLKISSRVSFFFAFFSFFALLCFFLTSYWVGFEFLELVAGFVVVQLLLCVIYVFWFLMWCRFYRAVGVLIFGVWINFLGIFLGGVW